MVHRGILRKQFIISSLFYILRRTATPCKRAKIGLKIRRLRKVKALGIRPECLIRLGASSQQNFQMTPEVSLGGKPKSLYEITKSDDAGGDV
jgi:hypothetical protein